MKSVFRKPRAFKSRTFLRRRGRITTAQTDLLNVDSAERKARRTVWMRNRDERRATSYRKGQVGFVGALVALLIALVLSFSTSTSALERAALAKELDQRQAVVAEQENGEIRPASSDVTEAARLSLRS